MNKLPEKKKKKKVKKLNKGDWYDAVDVPFNAYIRNRDKNRCVQCGSTLLVQCGHVIPKKDNVGVRWDIENAFAQCSSHNYKHNHNPHLYINWYRKKFGDEQWDKLSARADELCLVIDYREQFYINVQRCESIGYDIRSFILNSPYYKQKVKKIFPDIIEEWQKGS